MNLHITNDDYGFFPVEIAKRIEGSPNVTNNKIINLSSKSKIQHSLINYIKINSNSFKNFIKEVSSLDKIIFHPFNINSLSILEIVRKKFPNVKVYWVCWSYELYNSSENIHNLYDSFSRNYIARNRDWKLQAKVIFLRALMNSISIINSKKTLKMQRAAAYKSIDFFCSFLPQDFVFYKSITSNLNTQYIPFSYLSLNNIMPNLYEFESLGDKIMIGHSATPEGNHFEIIERVKQINQDLPIFLPLAYGNLQYAAIIKRMALEKLKNVEILESKMDILDYYKKLTEVSWVILNVKVQQGLGNILALIWMGAKIFLTENSSTFIDFKNWGINVFSIENDLNEEQLTQKLTLEEIRENKKIIYNRFNEEKVNKYWESILY